MTEYCRMPKPVLNLCCVVVTSSCSQAPAANMAAPTHSATLSDSQSDSQKNRKKAAKYVR